jgi:hypothetical protein
VCGPCRASRRPAHTARRSCTHANDGTLPGLWEPYQIEGTTDEAVNRWGAATFRHFETLSRCKDGAAAGVQFVTCHALTTEPSKAVATPAWATVAHNYTSHLPVRMPPPSLVSYGESLALRSEFGTWVADQSYYLPFLAAQVRAAGVRRHSHRVQSFHELARAGYKFVFNCAGALPLTSPCPCST